MGIDIYASWAGMTPADRDAQYTGWRVDAGDVGYLREAYHGGPYATRELVPEAFEEDLERDGLYHGAELAAATLRGRLPRAIIAALVREATTYRSATARDLLNEVGIEPAAPGSAIERASERSGLAGALLQMLRDASAVADGEGGLDPEVRAPESVPVDWLTRAAAEVDMVASLIAFVRVCERREAETGRPCRILASW